jgi:hypothetical protein
MEGATQLGALPAAKHKVSQQLQLCIALPAPANHSLPRLSSSQVRLPGYFQLERIVAE